MEPSIMMPPLNGWALLAREIENGCSVERFRPITAFRFESTQARELSGEMNIWLAVKLPNPRLYEVTVLCGVGGQPDGIAPVGTTSREGESATTAPLPLGRGATSVGLTALNVCQSLWLQVARTSIAPRPELVMYVMPPWELTSMELGTYGSTTALAVGKTL